MTAAKTPPPKKPAPKKTSATKKPPAEKKEGLTLTFSNDELRTMGEILGLAHKASDITASRAITHFLDKFQLGFAPPQK